MSLELDWSLLDDQLAQGILDRLNKSLASASRPDFLGPIKLTSLEFGDDAPDVRLTQVGDVWRQFLDHANTVKEGAAVRSATTNKQPDDVGDDDTSGDVSVPGEFDHPRTTPLRPGDHLTKFAERALPFTGQTTVKGGPRLQTFRQYTPSDIQQIHGTGSVASFPATTALGTPLAGGGGGSGSASRSASGLGTPAWGPGLGTRSSFVNQSASGYFSPWQSQLRVPGVGPGHRLQPSRPHPNRRESSFFAPSQEGRSPSAEFGAQHEAEASPSSVPSLQLHFSTVWSTNTFKLGINTSLLINHPTPVFMELPLSVSVIGLGVQTGCVVAFEEGEGKGRKVHISLVEDDDDDEEEEGSQGTGEVSPNEHVTIDPPIDAAKPSSVVNGSKSQSPQQATTTTSKQSPPSLYTRPPNGNSNAMLQPPQRPLTVGERLIPHITLETSVGNADKHVLRNVGKVEKFLIELLRKAVEDELVWPNFYTVALPS